MSPEPIVIATQYDVSCLPENHRDRRHFTVRVRYCGTGWWAVTDMYGDEYSEDGELGLYLSSPSPRRRFSLDEALALAKRIAPTLVVNGRTVVDVLARGGGQ